MNTRPARLTPAEIAAAFAGEAGERYPPLLSLAQLAHLLGKPVKTIYAWHAAGRFRGASRKRGKHVLIWRDRVIDILMSGRDWTA